MCEGIRRVIPHHSLWMAPHIELSRALQRNAPCEAWQSHGCGAQEQSELVMMVTEGLDHMSVPEVRQQRRAVVSRLQVPANTQGSVAYLRASWDMMFDTSVMVERATSNIRFCTFEALSCRMSCIALTPLCSCVCTSAHNIGAFDTHV
jgi:hypothetical protein